MPDRESMTAAEWLARRRRLDSLLRIQAAVMTGEPRGAEAVRLLADAVVDPAPEVRELAAAALSEFGPEALGALPELLRAAQDESAVVRRRAVRAIGFIGPAAADDALPVLLGATEDVDESVSLQAVASLGELGPAAAPAVPALLAAVWTRDVRRRAIAGVALTRVGAPAVPALVQSLSHPAADVRVKVVHLLGRIGPAAAEAVTALHPFLDDADDRVRSEAAAALRAMEATG